MNLYSIKISSPGSISLVLSFSFMIGCGALKSPSLTYLKLNQKFPKIGNNIIKKTILIVGISIVYANFASLFKLNINEKATIYVAFNTIKKNFSLYR